MQFSFFAMLSFFTIFLYTVQGIPIPTTKVPVTHLDSSKSLIMCPPPRTIVGIIPESARQPVSSGVSPFELSISVSNLEISASWLSEAVQLGNSGIYANCGYSVSIPQIKMACGFTTFIVGLSMKDNFITLKDAIPEFCNNNIYPIIIGGHPSPSYVYEHVPSYIKYVLTQKYNMYEFIAVDTVRLFNDAPWVINEQDSFGGTAVLMLNCGIISKYSVDLSRNFIVLIGITQTPEKQCNNIFPIQFFPSLESAQQSTMNTIIA
jgi:hypothetical protein